MTYQQPKQRAHCATEMANLNQASPQIISTEAFQSSNYPNYWMYGFSPSSSARRPSLVLMLSAAAAAAELFVSVAEADTSRHRHRSRRCLLPVSIKAPIVRSICLWSGLLQFDAIVQTLLSALSACRFGERIGKVS